MRDQKHIASLLGSVFSYALVDEYQDTKQIQYGLHVSQQKSECTGAIFTFKPFLNIGLANRGRPCTSGQHTLLTPSLEAMVYKATADADRSNDLIQCTSWC